MLLPTIPILSIGKAPENLRRRASDKVTCTIVGQASCLPPGFQPVAICTRARCPEGRLEARPTTLSTAQPSGKEFVGDIVLPAIKTHPDLASDVPLVSLFEAIHEAEQAMATFLAIQNNSP